MGCKAIAARCCRCAKTFPGSGGSASPEKVQPPAKDEVEPPSKDKTLYAEANGGSKNVSAQNTRLEAECTAPSEPTSSPCNFARPPIPSSCVGIMSERLPEVEEQRDVTASSFFFDFEALEALEEALEQGQPAWGQSMVDPGAPESVPVGSGLASGLADGHASSHAEHGGDAMPSPNGLAEIDEDVRQCVDALRSAAEPWPARTVALALRLMAANAQEMPSGTVVDHADQPLGLVLRPSVDGPQNARALQSGFIDQLWEVVGGAERGGIIVRIAYELESTLQPQRLSHGSVVQELELRGERLHYLKLTGSGPDIGWVSTRIKNKELLVRRDSLPESARAADDSRIQRCLACEDSPVNACLVPCGHVMLCFSCALRLDPRRCPLCRLTIDHIARTDL